MFKEIERRRMSKKRTRSPTRVEAICPMWMGKRRTARSEERPKIILIYCYDHSEIKSELSKLVTSPLKSEPQLRLRADQRGSEYIEYQD